MGGLKEPGPDEIPTFSYHKAWEIVANDISDVFLHFFGSGYLPKEWNFTYIVLIPKVDCLEISSQFQPISLSNVIYKIISKCLTNRLKMILQNLVGPFQNAFVPKRAMGDNCLLAHEVLTFVKRRTKGFERFAVLMIDMNKAYD